MTKILAILKTALQCWLLVAVAVTGVYLLVYIAAQQNFRQNANDPQIQLAEDAAAKLASGQSTQDVVPAEKVNIAASLASYIVIFDANGKPIASSGQLNGQMPTIPSGVFDSVRQNGEERITWQPQDAVRSAIVVTRFKGMNSGFVLAGRSLRESEKRDAAIFQLLTLGWIGILLGTLVVAIVLFRNTTESSAKAG